MTTDERIATLKRSIATLTDFIERKSTPQNSKEKAQATRDELQRQLDRLTAHAARPAR